MKTKHSRLVLGTLVVALAALAFMPHAAQASGRGLFKDIYCKLMSLAGKECVTEIDGVEVRFESQAQ